MALDIPDELAARANTFPESSYGAVTVTLVLASGRRIGSVVLAGARIVEIGGQMVSGPGDLDFSPEEVVDVVRADRPALATLRRAWRQIRNAAGLHR